MGLWTEQLKRADLLFSQGRTERAVEIYARLEKAALRSCNTPLRLFHRQGKRAVCALINQKRNIAFLGLEVSVAQRLRKTLLSDRAWKYGVITQDQISAEMTYVEVIEHPIERFRAIYQNFVTAALYGRVVLADCRDINGFVQYLGDFETNFAHLDNPFLPLSVTMPQIPKAQNVALPLGGVPQECAHAFEIAGIPLELAHLDRSTVRWANIAIDALTDTSLAQLLEFYAEDLVHAEPWLSRQDYQIVEPKRTANPSRPISEDWYRTPISDLETMLRDPNWWAGRNRRTQMASHLAYRNPAPWIARQSRAKTFDVLDFLDGTVRYFCVSKCASTSVKSLFYSLENSGRSFREDHPHPRNDTVHDHFFGRTLFSLSEGAYAPEFQFAVVRDPVERFISAFRNRIYTDFLSGWFNSFESLHQNVSDSLNAFVAQLERHHHATFETYSHIQFQFMMLPDNISRNIRIYKIEKLDQLAKDLVPMTNQISKIPRLQQTGPSMDLAMLTPENLERLLSFYSEDYAFLKGYYSKNDIREKFHALRSA